MLAARRFDDNYADMLSVFNRTQENLIRGDLVGAVVADVVSAPASCRASTRTCS